MLIILVVIFTINIFNNPYQLIVCFYHCELSANITYWFILKIVKSMLSQHIYTVELHNKCCLSLYKIKPLWAFVKWCINWCINKSRDCFSWVCKYLILTFLFMHFMYHKIKPLIKEAIIDLLMDFCFWIYDFVIYVKEEFKDGFSLAVVRRILWQQYNNIRNFLTVWLNLLSCELKTLICNIEREARTIFTPTNIKRILWRKYNNTRNFLITWVIGLNLRRKMIIRTYNYYKPTILKRVQKIINKSIKYKQTIFIILCILMFIYGLSF